METPFAITPQNSSRVAAVGRHTEAARSFGVRYFVDALRGSRATADTWEALAGVDTVLLTLSRPDLKGYETEFLKEARSRGLTVGLLWCSSWEMPNDENCVFDFLAKAPSPNDDEENESSNFPGTGLLLGQREPQDGVAKVGADFIIRVPKDRIDNLKRYEKELDDSIYEMTSLVPKGGRLILDSSSSVPIWMADVFFRKLHGYNTTVVIAREGRTVQPEELTEFVEELKVSWAKSFPRKVIVLGESESAGTSLSAAIAKAKTYNNPSGESTVIDATPRDYGWKWQDAFEEAQNRPNTFIVLEDGSVLRKRIVELSGELRVISALGGGLSFGHQSNALFDYLGADSCILADEPLNKLIGHLQIDHYLDEMSLLNPVDRKDKIDSARKTVESLLAQGVSVAEVSRRMGLNRSTIHRWLRVWKED